MRRSVGVVAGAALVVVSVLGLAPSVVEGATTAGTMGVLAGTAVQGFAGNGGSATTAQFYDPSDEAVAGNGTVYIADMKNCQVRQVIGGTVSLFAGGGGNDATCATGGGAGSNPLGNVPGPAASATIGMPTGLALDNAGDLFIADCTNYTGNGSGCVQGSILEVSGGTISTFLAPAQFGNGAPWGIRVAGGNVYFSDVVNNVVDEVSTSGGAVTRVAGNGTAGYSGNPAAATSAALDDPTGLSVDGSGNIFIADSKNAVVREVSGGVITTIAGNGTAGVSGDDGPATSAELTKPFGVAEDGAGNVYIADYGAFCVREVTKGTIVTFAGSCGTQGYLVNGVSGTSALFGSLSPDTPPGGPSQVVFDGSNNLIVNDYGDNQVDQVAVSANAPIKPTTPTITNLPSAPVAGQSFVAAISTDGDGTKSVQSSSTGVCSVGSDGLTVSFLSSGNCSLTPQVAAGAAFGAASGATKVLKVAPAGKITPTAPTITDVPTFAQVGHSFVATVSTTGDGITSVTSNSAAVCRVGTDGVTVSFVASGTCSLTPQVSPGATYAGATGAPQSFFVSPVTGATGAGASQGYWTVATDGGVFNYGDAGFYGSTGALHLNSPIWGMARTPDARGYWLVATDGGIFNYGDAGFYGSAGGIRLNQPIVGMAATPDGKGYWLVASDGGIFNYGDAKFFGSTGSIHLNQPIVGMAASPTGTGYWMVASDGGIFNYGDAGFYGSTGGLHLNKPIVSMAAAPDGKGYWMVGTDGGVFNYGDAQYEGSAGGIHLNNPVVGIAPGS